MNHSARSSAGRTSSTVTSAPRSRSSRRSSTSSVGVPARFEPPLATVMMSSSNRAARVGVLGTRDRQASRLPVRKPDIEPARAIPASPELEDRFVRIDAERPAAIGDDLAALRNPPQSPSQLLDRERAGSGDMPGAILDRRAHVEHQNLVPPDALEQLRAAHAFEPLAPRHERLEEPIDLGELGLTEPADRLPDSHH